MVIEQVRRLRPLIRLGVSNGCSCNSSRWKWSSNYSLCGASPTLGGEKSSCTVLLVTVFITSSLMFVFVVIFNEDQRKYEPLLIVEMVVCECFYPCHARDLLKGDGKKQSRQKAPSSQNVVHWHVVNSKEANTASESVWQ